MHYTDCHTPVQRGGISGTRAEIVLRPGEFITRIEGVFETNVIATLKFKTNKGMVHTDPVLNSILYSSPRIIGVIFGPYGKKDVIPSQVPFVWNGVDNAPPGLAHRMGLLYFSGNAWPVESNETFRSGANVSPVVLTFASFGQHLPFIPVAWSPIKI